MTKTAHLIPAFRHRICVPVYNSVQNLTALENAELAAQICKDPLPAATVLEEVGLKDRLLNLRTASGGEQQRVARSRVRLQKPENSALR